MRKLLIGSGAFLLVYLVLSEVAWRSDFMAALAGVRQGRPMLALVEVCFFALRVLLLVAGPPFLVALAWFRLTKS